MHIIKCADHKVISPRTLIATQRYILEDLCIHICLLELILASWAEHNSIVSPTGASKYYFAGSIILRVTISIRAPGLKKS